VHGPSTTDHPFEVSIDVAGHTLRFIDTPGLSFLTQNNTESEITRAKDILIRSRGRIDRLKDPVLPSMIFYLQLLMLSYSYGSAVPEIVTRANAQDLILFYNIPVFAKDDTNAFLTALARANHVAKKVYQLFLSKFCLISYVATYRVVRLT
jgi:nuclear GTP-binding protein